MSWTLINWMEANGIASLSLVSGPLGNSKSGRILAERGLQTHNAMVGPMALVQSQPLPGKPGSSPL